MRKAVLCLIVAALWGAGLEAQTPAPQTARQALMEMFGKTQGTFLKHLPAATRAALEKSGALTQLQQYSAMAGQMQTQGQTLQTFETGPVMLAADDPKTNQKFEITVENDTLRGDRDDIELSFRAYKEGKAQRTPFMPQITFTMKQEAKVWTLNEISLTLHLPLADPDLLKALTEKMKPQTTNVTFTPQAGTPQTFTPKSGNPAPMAGPHVTYAAQNETPMQPAGTDAMVIGALHSILTAEATYARLYPTVGFTCTLSSLDGFGNGEPNERQAMLINSGLASGKRYGFVFTLSGCSGAPATSFQLTASPNGNSFGRKAFCADQSGAIRSSEDGNAATCLASGAVIP